MTGPLFHALDSAAIAAVIRTARQSVCYAAPGIQAEPAAAMAEFAKRFGPKLVTVCLDFDERVMRMTAEATRAAHLLDRLDERLLARAFRGELVPQDPADEPAEALLARLRATRAAAPKAKRGRRPKAPA